jgi:hydroxyacylglutathione hydrolase
MALSIIPFVLGPLENNTYLVADQPTGQAAIIDPSFESEIVLEEAAQRGWTITSIWLTHAHFDHIAGVGPLAAAIKTPLTIGLHPGDLVLWRQGGGAPHFGFKFESGPEPDLRFSHGQKLQLGESVLEVRHTPGHTRGHVIFYAELDRAALVGDLIFRGSVGRTDLMGGDLAALLSSIHTQVLTLPPATRLLSGHGPETTVREEMDHNPFLV